MKRLIRGTATRAYRNVFVVWFGLICAAGAPPSSFAQGTKLSEFEVRPFFVLANLEFTILHEIGHMLIDELDLPVLGMEEDAADRIAMISMLIGRNVNSNPDFLPWVFAVAGDWYTEWEMREDLQQQIKYWDNHALEIQRFHNLVCLIYGSNPEFLSDLIDTMPLPFERALDCTDEFEQARHAVGWVLKNYGRDRFEPQSKISVHYEEPLTKNGELFSDWLDQSQIAENITTRIEAIFYLPRDIKLQFVNCDGDPDAFWLDLNTTIFICYELMEHFLAIAEHRLKNAEIPCGNPTLRQYVGDKLGCDAIDQLKLKNTDENVPKGQTDRISE